VRGSGTRNPSVDRAGAGQFTSIWRSEYKTFLSLFSLYSLLLKHSPAPRPASSLHRGLPHWLRKKEGELPLVSSFRIGPPWLTVMGCDPSCSFRGVAAKRRWPRQQGANKSIQGESKLFP
jgi:hypothetical protein